MKKVLVVIIAIFTNLVSSCGNDGAITTQKGSITPKNICEFSAQDYDQLRNTLKNSITGNTILEAQKVLSSFNFPEISYPEIGNGLRSTMHQQKKLLFDQKYGQVEFKCYPGNENVDIWSIQLIADENNKILESDLYITFEDQSFLERDIRISSTNYTKSAFFSTALLDVSDKYEGDWTKVKAELINGGFRTSYVRYPNQIALQGDPKINQRIFYRLHNLPHGPFAIVYLDDEGRKIKSVSTKNMR